MTTSFVLSSDAFLTSTSQWCATFGRFTSPSGPRAEVTAPAAMGFRGRVVVVMAAVVKRLDVPVPTDAFLASSSR
eukprot:CAMPEP_0181033992 /NCGR_PEP_ID=MMETSP1070-20121207/7570_1 /TAXON_ID=265543 /ORGANISM="Minutocellus polymorphus, Strain NH13" /LENGTH=74 /DNA_ID=CAMNT_0023111491 /DNA_START=74 /DNA_END=295 /DNA_ORIENTATION=-